MKRFYTLTATLAAAFVMSALAYPADDTESGNIKVLWNSVDVVPVDTRASVIVRANIVLVNGESFSDEVYPVIYSSDYRYYGEGEPKSVTLSKSGPVETGILEWRFNLDPSWSRDGSSQMECYIYYKDDINKAVQIGHVPVNHSGITGVADIAVLESLTFTEVYTVGGVRVAQGADVDLQSLSPGMYIVRQGDTCKKVMRR